MVRRKFFVTLWLLYIAVIGVVAYLFHAIFVGDIGYMPEIEQLQNPVNKYASQVLSSDGRLLGTWSYSRANRIFVSYEDLSPSLV